MNLWFKMNIALKNNWLPATNPSLGNDCSHTLQQRTASNCKQNELHGESDREISRVLGKTDNMTLNDPLSYTSIMLPISSRSFCLKITKIICSTMQLQCCFPEGLVTYILKKELNNYTTHQTVSTAYHQAYMCSDFSFHVKACRLVL